LVVASTPEAGEQVLAIDRQALEDMFANAREKTSWNIDADMLWGYFFYGPNERDLTKLGADLARIGYRVVVIREVEYDTPLKEPKWLLHVEKGETHSVDTLVATNTELEDLASRYEYVVYDGMDFGPAD
jgi:hypothetical protein